MGLHHVPCFVKVWAAGLSEDVHAAETFSRDVDVFARACEGDFEVRSRCLEKVGYGFGTAVAGCWASVTKQEFDILAEPQ